MAAQIGAVMRADRTYYAEEDHGFSSPCWIWQKARRRNGYGAVWADGRVQEAHRVFFTQRKGPIPEGFEVDHLCRVRACVNPAHLEAVTSAVNTQRGSKAKLTPAGALQIRLMRMTTTLSYPQIADVMGISHSQACQVVNNNHWKVPQ